MTDVDLLPAPAVPGRPDGALSALARQQILIEWNDIAASPALATAVEQRVAAQAARRPEAIAVSAPDGCLSYGELLRRAEALAALLLAHGAGPDVPVALFLDRTSEMPVAMLAAFLAGSVYLPLDPRHPRERLAHAIRTAKPAVLLAGTGVTAELPLDEGVEGPAVVRLADFDEQPAARANLPPNQALPEHLSYLRFTSGSTGVPKGVACTRGALANLLRWLIGEVGIDERDRMLAVTTLAFDIAEAEIWPPLLTGGRLEIAPAAESSDGRALLHRLDATGTTVLGGTPATFRLLLAAGWTLTPGLKIYVAGEALAGSLAARMLAAIGDGKPGVRAGRLWNLYGPTEATVYCSWAVIDAAEARESNLAIGRTVAGARLHLLDARRRAVETGAEGEVWVGGPALARGYIGKPGLTAERFLPDPLAGTFPGAPAGSRLYRTGDLARLRPDGRLEYLGRIDHQVKIRGFRIELGEIETVLGTHPDIAETRVLAREGSAEGDKRLVAYAVTRPGPRPGYRPALADLAAHLRTRLPEYMVPSAFVLMPAFPLAPNGKVDVRALPAPRRDDLVVESAYVAPRNPLEARLAELVAKVIGCERTGIEDDFFSLGGNSLLANSFLVEVEHALGVELSLRQLFATPTVAGLAAAVAAAPAAGRRASPTAGPRDQPEPLAPIQSGMWILQRLDAESASFNIPMSTDLSGRFSVSHLRAALREVVQRHAPLRTVYRPSDAGPVQIVRPPFPVALPLVDLSSLAAGPAAAEAERLTQREAKRWFDLDHGPVLRAYLLRSAADRHRFSVNVHHIAADGWAMGVLMRELGEAYRALAAGRPSPLGEPEIRYTDIVRWNRERLDPATTERHLAAWREILAGYPTTLALPADRPHRSSEPVSRALGVRHLVIPAAVVEEVEALARERATTPFVILLAAYQALLGRLSRQDELVTGSVVSHRNTAASLSLVGLFAHGIALPARLAAGGRSLSFDELLEQVRATVLLAFEHQDLSLERVAEDVGAKDREPGAQLFPVSFVLQNEALPPPELPRVTGTPLRFTPGEAKLDLILDLYSRNDRLEGQLEYRAALFDATTAERIARGYVRLLAAVLAAPRRPLGQLELRSAAEAQQLLEWNATALAPAPRPPLHGMALAWAAASPDAIAVAAAGERLSYGEMARRAAALAGELGRRGPKNPGIEPDAIVAVGLPRGPAFVTATLGVLLAGGAYLPLDPTLPDERLRFMVEDAGARWLVADAGLAGRLGSAVTSVIDFTGYGAPVPDVAAGLVPAGDGADGTTAGTGPAATGVDIPPDGTTAGTSPAATFRGEGGYVTGVRSITGYEAAFPAVSLDHAAYVIYTSGTTGRPKGVVITHRGITHLARQSAVHFGTGGKGRVVQFASLGFDASVLEQWSALAGGACLVVPEEDERSSPQALAAFLAREAVTASLLTPSVLSWLEPAAIPALDHLCVGAEACPGELAARWSRDRTLRNCYGPTEISIYCTTHLCVPGERREPPIGRPIGDAQVLVADTQGRPAPLGVAGELWIGGEGVARGYLGRPGLTAWRFVPHPLAAALGRGGARVYRSGDRARWRADGELEFLGRVDAQVKVRGYRIEPGEIEAALLALPSSQGGGFEQVKVVARSGAVAGDQRLIAYCVPAGLAGSPPAEPDATALARALGERLPPYMVPAVFVFLPRMPLTASGKVDVRALPAPVLGGVAADRRPPATATEQALAELWTPLLQVPEPGRDDNFFHLGGHSLLASRLLLDIERRFGIVLPLRQLFRQPTLEALAGVIDQARGSQVASSGPRLVRRERSGPLPLSFAQERLWFLDQLAPGSPAYNVPAALDVQGRLEPAALRHALGAIVARHEALHTVFVAERGQPRQVIQPPPPFPLPAIDLSGLAAADRPRETEVLARREARRPFDLARGPLFRGALVRRDRDAWTLLLNLHHIAGDGWSVSVLTREISAYYGGWLAGEEPKLPPLAVQYADYALWQREWLASGTLEEQLAFWRQALAGAPDLLPLPLDFPRPAVASEKAENLGFALDPALTATLGTLARGEEATLYALTLAAFQALLGRLCGEDDLLVGSPVAGRPRSEIGGLIGFFVNTIALRARLRDPASGGYLTFRQLLRQVRDTARAALEHQEVPFEQVIDDLKIERSLAYNPLFQVMFVFHSQDDDPGFELPGVAVHPLRLDHGIAKFDLSFGLWEEGKGISGLVDYRRDLFTAPTIEKLTASFLAVLKAVAANPDVPLDALPVTLAAPAASGAAKASEPTPESREAVASERLSSAEQRLAEKRAGLSDAKRAMLARLVRRDAPAAEKPALPRTSAPRIPPRPPGPARVSFAQERMWFLEQLEPGDSFYNVPLFVRLRGALDLGALDRALALVQQRHEVLRSRLISVDGTAEQVADLVPQRLLPIIDLRAITGAARERLAARLSAREARRGFDLATGPVYRQSGLRLADDDHVLMFSMHHVVSDTRSSELLLAETVTGYRAFHAGEKPALPELAVQYADYAAWQRQWLEGEAYARQLGWWKAHLAALPPLLDLPADRPRPAVQSFRGTTRQLELPAQTLARLRELAQQENATHFMIGLAAFALFLNRHAGQRDLAVGTPISGRHSSEIEGLIGFFLNTLVMRLDVRPEQGFLALVRQAKAVSLDAYANQDLPFERLVDELRPERSLAYSPLFQTMLVFQTILPPTAVGALGGLAVEPFPVHPESSKFDLLLAFTEDERSLGASFEFATDLFDVTTIERWLAHLDGLLAGALAEPLRPVGELPLLTAAERWQLLGEVNDTAAAIPRSNLGALLLAPRESRPEAVALVFHGSAAAPETWTYGALAGQAERLARRLADLGVGPDQPVALCLERQGALVTAVLAVLLAGGAYVPLDPAYPADRLTFMLEDSEARVLLTERRQTGLAPAAGVTRLLLEDELPAAAGLVPLPPRPVDADHLAYVIYTSGTTGRPKGTGQTVRMLANLAAWQRAARGAAHDAGRRGLGYASASFDVFAQELAMSLAGGGTLHLVPESARRDPEELAGLLLAARIEDAILPPVMLQQLAEHWLGGEGTGADLPYSLVHLTTTGEAMQITPAVARLLARLPGCRLHNFYGPAETHGVTGSTLRTPPETWPMYPPIGAPIANARLHLADRRGQPVGIGLVGEVRIGGAGLARGYLGRPRLTAERFVPDPHASPRIDSTAGERGGRLYRTGDLARWRADGELEFQGRIDHQVKLRGFRIELGEIEAVLAAHPQVGEVVVLVRGGAGGGAGDRRLVAYVVPPAGSPPPAEPELRRHLAERLPEHMVPAAFVVLEALPLTVNGKVDRRALPDPEWTAAAGFAKPETPAEELLAGIWAAVLGVERVGREDSFFALGGHSLLGTRVLSRVREAFGVEMPLRFLFESPTLEGAARAIDAEVGRGALAFAPPLVRRPSRDRQPLSFAQERLWFLDRLAPGQATYNLASAVRLEGELSLATLAATLDALTRRHSVLRSRFESTDGQPFAVIAPPVVTTVGRTPLPVADLSRLADPFAAVSALARRESERPFDLARGPLLRARVLRLGACDHVVLFALHHIVADGWSFGVLTAEVAALYTALRAGTSISLPELPVQYGDFAAWQRQWLAGEVLATQIVFWRQALAGAPPVLDLPLDRPRSATPTSRGGLIELPLPAATSEAIPAVARELRATPFMLLLAAFEAMLGRFCGQEDFVVGSPVANRGRLELEGLIGLFVNNLALRADLSGRPSFADLVARSRAAVLAAYAHQDLPFERLVEELAVPRSLAYHPVFQTVFTVQTRAPGELDLPGLAPSFVNPPVDSVKLDLLCGFAETADGLWWGDLQYNGGLFDRTTGERMARALARLLTAALAAPSRPWSELPLLSTAEEAALRLEWNDRGWLATAARPEERLDQLFAAALARSPEAVALASADEQVSYAALAQRAGALATRLREALAGGAASPLGRPLVGIFLPRGIDFVVAVLAAFQAGAAYLPLDPSHPAERLAFTVADSGAAVVIVKDGARSFGDAVATVEIEANVTGLKPMTGYKGLETGVSADHLAYVIYTSGSTGKPNGVMVPHGAASRLIRSAVGHFGVTATSRLVQVVSTSFDASVLETWMALAAGARLVLPEEEMRRDADALAAFCRCQAVTTAVLTPAVLALLDPAELPGLRNLSVGGESCPPEVVRRWSLDRSLLNCYGPTETTIYATFHRCHDEGEREAPLGLPVEGATAYVLDRRGMLVPPGAAGELWLGGLNLARGYLRRPALTARRFRPDLLGRASGGRLYATGDRVRRNGSGELEFLGRIDQQVKIRGLRIELGEVEAALQRHPAVAEAVVAVHAGPGGEKALAAYVVPAVGESDLVARLRADLHGALPDYMVPATFHVLESLPRTPTGKLDRRALPAPDAVAGAERVAPRNLLELSIARVWQEVLGLAEVGVRESFFELGGHSLLAVRLLARLRAELGVELPLTALFSAGTIEGLAALVRAGEASSASLLVPIQPRGGRRPLFLIHPAGGDVLCYAALGPHLGSEQPLYGLRSRGLEAGEEPLASLAEMAATYLAEVRRFQPQGPYALGGWSLGGLVAFEMARQLAAAGEAVAPLLILDTTAGMVGPAAPSETDLLLDVATYVETLWGKALGLAREDLDALPSAERVELFVERLQAVDFLPEGAGPETVRRLLAVYASNLAAAGNYRPEPYAGPLVLLAASERGSVMDEGPVPAGDGGLLADPSLGWSAVAAEVAVETLPGTHLSLLAEPAIAGLAARVAAWLERTAGASPAAT